MKTDDDWQFEVIRTEDIRETDDYPGIRVFMTARYAPMAVPLSIDVTTGNRIIPGPLEYTYPLMFDEGSIELVSYLIDNFGINTVEEIPTSPT